MFNMNFGDAIEVTLLLSLIGGSSISEARSKGGGGGCLYKFQVWQPGADVMQTLRSLEFRCDNSSSYTMNQLLQVKSQLLSTMAVLQNNTFIIQRDLSAQLMKIVDVQRKQNDFYHKLNGVEVTVDSVEKRVDHVTRDLKSVNSKVFNTNSDSPFPPLALTSRGPIETDTLIVTMKTTIGDLKAEWVLLKREMRDMKSETMQLKYGQNGITSDTTKLKDFINNVQSDTSRMKIKQKEMSGKMEELKKLLESVKLDSIEIKDTQSDVRLDVVTMKEGLLTLKSKWFELETDLNMIHLENRHLKNILRKLLASGNSTDWGMLLVDLEDRALPIPPAQAYLSLQPNLNTKMPMPETPQDRTPSIPRDCGAIYKNGYMVSGVYEIQPIGSRQLDKVYCEMVNNTGWTLIQRRGDGLINFNRRWLEYKYGFGSLYGEFWMGNEKIHLMTREGDYVLRIDMWDWEGNRIFAEYSSFSIDGEADKYRLHLRGYHGNAGDSFSFHSSMSFSTEDVDNDLNARQCAVDFKSGWWYNSCYSSNLNGVYRMGWYGQGTAGFADGIVWFTLKESDSYSLKAVEMKIRRKK